MNRAVFYTADVHFGCIIIVILTMNMKQIDEIPWKLADRGSSRARAAIYDKGKSSKLDAGHPNYFDNLNLLTWTFPIVEVCRPHWHQKLATIKSSIAHYKWVTNVVQFEWNTPEWMPFYQSVGVLDELIFGDVLLPLCFL